MVAGSNPAASTFLCIALILVLHIVMKVYYTPPVPGGLLGQSAALAYQQGATTPGQMMYQTGKNFILQLMMMFLVIGLILLLVSIFGNKSPESKTTPPEHFKSSFTEKFDDDFKHTF